MDVESNGFRAEVRSILEGEWDPDRYRADLAGVTAAGGAPVGDWHRLLQSHRLVAPHYPEAYGGRGGTHAHRAVVTEELDRIGALPPSNVIGVGWAGPAILAHGSEEQRRRYLPPLLEGDEIWCQLFSEPGAGSDLAGLSTRAEPDGDEFVITGQKIWTSGAHHADFGILLARTDPDAPKHRGISYFVFPMRQPGVDIRPIRQMTGEAEFCEVFLDGARVPAANLVGRLNDGWRVAITTLMNERISLSTGLGMLWGSGMSFRALWERATAEADGPLAPLERDRLTRLWIRNHVLGRLKAAALARAVAGGTPGVEAAIQKLLADTLGRDATEALVDLRGLGGLDASGDRLATEFLFARALTIGGGTEEVQKNILAERALGLPADP